MNVPFPPGSPNSAPPPHFSGDDAAARQQAVTALIDALHASPWRIVIAVTGGGSRAIADLLSRPGASATLISATVPYSPAALQAFLHCPPTDAAASRATARQMAMRAYLTARQLEAADPHRPAALAGVACTAALATGRARRGAERAHVGVQTARQTLTWSLQMPKGLRDRAAGEALTADLIHHALGTLIDRPLPLMLDGGDALQTACCRPPQACVDLLHAEVDLVSVNGAIETAQTLPSPSPAGAVPLLFSGSFNPWHEGHREMARIARELTGWSAAWELSIENVDKPPLDYVTLRERIAQFAGQTSPLLLTRASRFVEKARLFPGTLFVVGADTALRLDDPVYYGHSADARDQALREMHHLGCRLLIFGRLTDEGFADAERLELSPAMAAMCQRVAASVFRNDISSSALRARRPAD